MKFCKRIVALLVLLLGVAFFALCLGVAIGVWVILGPVTERATTLFERIESALKLADQSLTQVSTSLGQSMERLNDARVEQKKLAQAPPKTGVLRRMLVRTVQQNLGPEFANAQKKLQAVAEASVVVNSVLDDLGNIPLLAAKGIDTEQIAEMNHRLADLGPAAWELSRLLGDNDTEAEAEAQFSRIEQTLRTMQTTLGQYEQRVTEVRQRTGQVKSLALSWLTPVAILVSLIGLWLALSQVSMMAHAWSWLRN